MVLRKYRGDEYVAILKEGEEPDCHFSVQVKDKRDQIDDARAAEVYEEVDSKKVLPAVLKAVGNLNEGQRVDLEFLLGKERPYHIAILQFGKESKYHYSFQVTEDPNEIRKEKTVYSHKYDPGKVDLEDAISKAQEAVEILNTEATQKLTRKQKANLKKLLE